MNVDLRYKDDFFIKTNQFLIERIKIAALAAKKVVLVSAGVGIVMFGMDMSKDIINDLKDTSLVKMLYSNTVTHEVKKNNIPIFKPQIKITPHQQYLNNIKKVSSTWPEWNVEARDHKMSDKAVMNISSFFVQKEDYFMALASQVEGMRLHPYKDPAYGINIGFGYNITARANDNDDGREMVIGELETIGINYDKAKSIVDIATNTKKGNEDIAIKEIDKIGLALTPKQALMLLKITEIDYRSAAKKAFSNGWEQLNSNQQATLSYLTYQTGAHNLSQYKKLKKEIAGASSAVSDKKKELHLSAAQKNIETYYVDGGELVLNYRAKEIMQGMFSSVNEFKDTVGIKNIMLYDNLDNLNIENKRKSIVFKSSPKKDFP